MYPTKTKTVTNTPTGGGVDPLKINKNGVGESDVIFMGDRLYYITQDSYSEIMKYRKQMIKPDTKFKLLSVCLGISNAVTLALADDRIYTKILLTLSFAIVAATLLTALKNSGKQEETAQAPTPEPKINRTLSDKEMHKKKTALAMLRQLEN